MRTPALLCALCLTVASSAVAEWPMSRANPQRTGSSTKPLTITKPVVSWRKYLGGSLGHGQMEALDVDGNTEVDVVLISGGKLVAKQPDDTVIWESPPYSLNTIHQFVDFDGDGQLEIVASGEAAFLGIFSAKTGALVWRMRDGTFGTSVGAIRVADFNKDGKPDLYAADNACGSVNGKRVSLAFSFGGGYRPDDGSQRLWQLPDNRNYQCGYHDVVADLDGDGSIEVVAFSITTAYVYEGSTGQPIPASVAEPSFPLGYSLPYGQVYTYLADVDGDGKLSIIATSNNSYSPTVNSKAVAVFTWDRSRQQDQRLRVRWLHNVPDLVNDQHYVSSISAIDLDGDGKAEVITSFAEAGVLRAGVYKGATGELLSSLTGSYIRGAVTLRAGQRPTLIVEGGGTVKGFRFDSGIGTTFGTPVFEFGANRTAVLSRVFEVTRRESMPYRLITLLLANGSQGLVLSSGATLELWSPDAPTAAVATYTLPVGVAGLIAMPQNGISHAGPGLLFARSDGFLLALDATFKPVNFQGGGELSLPGIRTGGFYSGSRNLGHVPVAGKMGGSTEELLVVDSLARLQRLDASRASLVKPPESRWSWLGAVYPTLIDSNADGVFDQILAFRGGEVWGRKTDLAELFHFSYQTDGFGVSGDMIPLAGTTPARFAFPQTNSGTGEGRVLAFDATGIRWASPAIVTAGSGQGQLAADDLDGDGQDDVYGHFTSALRAYNAVDGALMGTGAGVYPSSPITVRGRAGPITHLALGAIVENQGLIAARPFTGFSTAWGAQIPERFGGSFAAVAQCPGGTGLVWGNTGYSSTHLVVGSVEDGGFRGNVVLTEGKQFIDDGAANDAGVLKGSLGNVNASGGTSPLMFVGSSDGRLYAVDPCAPTPTLKWSVDLRAPVGEPIFTDYDGDGADELVVEAADGFIYGIDQEQFPAPGWVIDTDADQPGATGDVNETSASRVSARWAAVPDAGSYQYAVFTVGGTPLTRNSNDPGDPFISVGPTVTTASHGEMLQAGNKYFFLVKALSSGGASSGETLSNGTRWAPGSIRVDAGTQMMSDAGTLPATDAGAAADGGSGPNKIGGSGSCGCSTGGPLSLLALGLLALLSRKARSD